jgi:hypothetical protein
MFGPEITGKTTLTILTDHYKTACSVARDYYRKWDKHQQFVMMTCFPIAYGQTRKLKITDCQSLINTCSAF